MTRLEKILCPALAFLMLVCSTAAFGQTNGALLPALPPAFENQNGVAAALGKLCAFAAGTNTPLAIYADSALTTSLPNPNSLNAIGMPTTNGSTATPIYIQPRNYKFVLYQAGATGASCPLTGTAIWTRDNVYDPALLPSFDNIQLCDRHIGATASIKINAAYAALPATGGVLDCRGFQGAQSISTTIILSKPVQLLLGAAEFSCTVDPCIRMLADNVSVVGLGPQSHINKTSGTGDTIEAGDGVTSSRDMVIRGLKVSGLAASAWCVDAQFAYNLTITGLLGSCASTTGGGVRIDNSIDVLIERIVLGAIATGGTGILQQNDSNGLTITGGRLDGFANTGGTGIKVSNYKSTILGTIVETFLNCVDIGGSGVFVTAYFEDCEFGIIDSNVSEGAVITGSTFQSSGISTAAINISAAIGVQITGNQFHGTHSSGAPINIDVVDGARNITIANNVFDDPTEVVFASKKFAQNNIDLQREHEFFRPKNYLENTFRVWPAGTTAPPILWELGAGTVAQRADAPYGQYSMDFAGVGSVSRRVVPTISATVDAALRGRWVVFSLWVKSISGATSGVLRMSVADGVATAEADYTITTDWARYTVATQLSATATIVNLGVNNLGTGTFAIAAPGFYVGTTIPRSELPDELDQGLLFLNAVSTALTGSASSTPFSITIPGRTLGDSGCIRARATGTTTNAAGGDKTAVIRLNTTAFTIAGMTVAGAAADNWVLDGKMCAITSSSQTTEQLALEGLAITAQTTATSTVNLDSAFTIDLTLSLADVADTITVKSFTIMAENR